MKQGLMAVVGAACLALGTVGAAQAVQLTFFGEDKGPGDPQIVLSGPLLNHPNADAAQAAFLALLAGVHTENFDGFPAGTLAPLNVSFAQPSGTVTATLSGIFSSVQAENPVGLSIGQYPISKANYVQSAFSPLAFFALSLEFSTPQAAFGFFGVDIGDAGAQVSLELALFGGGTQSVNIPNTSGNPLTAGGSVLYFGHIDTENLFTRVTLLSPLASDSFAFDNFTIASANQVVPEPNTLLLLGSGLTIGGFVLWRRRRTCV